MQKRLSIMLLGAFLLCALLGGVFAFSHIAGPAHAAVTDDLLTGPNESDFEQRARNDGKIDGATSCLSEPGSSWIDRSNEFPGRAAQQIYDQAWSQGFQEAGCGGRR